MYAKLVFPSTVTAGQAIRDIARLISASATGTAALANLQYITQASSEFVAGVNSGWTLHSSTPLQTGVQSITDNRYIFQGTTVNSVTKYIGIYANSDWTNVASWNQTTTSGFVLAPILDPATATVWYGNGYNGTTATIIANNCIWPNTSTLVAGGDYDSTMWIFADPRRLIIIGVDGRGKSMVQSSLEFGATPTSTTWKGLGPHAYFRISSTNIYSLLSIGDATAFGYRGSTMDNFSTTLSSSYLQFPNSIWSTIPTAAALRSFNVWHGQQSGAYNQDPVTAWKADGTTQGVFQTSTSIVGLGTQYNQTYDYIYQDTFGMDRTFWGGQYSTTVTNGALYQYWTSTKRTYDGTGAVSLPLMPITYKNLGLSSELYHFSPTNFIYWTYNGMGVRGDTVVNGADTWYYFPMTSLGYRPALMIKRT